jgi:tetratricopeptide (TPR) repeat protein
MAPIVTPRPDHAEVSAALDRVLLSPSFARSSRLTSFLRFIVNEQLCGRGTPPKEYVLGVQVFDRDPDYDPRIDPIVRVQARQLRFKLREYYDTTGRMDPIRIELPKGSYRPTIGYAVPEVPLAETAAQPVPHLEQAEPIAVPSLHVPGQPSNRWFLIAAALVMAAATGLLFARFAGPGWPRRQAKVNPDEHDLYLKGRFYWNKRSPESLKQAIDYFTQAIVKDPADAKAYAGLADCYNLLREYSVMPPSVAWPRAIAAAQKAVELDDSSAEAHTSLAFALFFGALDTARGEREFQRAIQLDPRYGKAHHWYATALMAIGRIEESFAQIEQARELDPASTSILADEGYILFFRGQTARAIDILKQVEMLEPASQSAHVYLARIYLDQGDSADYLREARQAAELSEDAQALQICAAARKAFASRGTQGMLQTILDRQKSLLAAGRLTHYEMAETYARMGQRQQAIDQLEAAVENREMNILVLGQDPALNCLHGEPHYQALRNKVKLRLQI